MRPWLYTISVLLLVGHVFSGIILWESFNPYDGNAIYMMGMLYVGGLMLPIGFILTSAGFMNKDRLQRWERRTFVALGFVSMLPFFTLLLT